MSAAPTDNGGWRALIEREVASAPFAAGVYVRDIASGETFESASSSKFQAASMIKLFVLWELYRASDEGSISLDAPHVLTGGERVDGGIMHAMREGVSLRLEDVALLMMSVSDNTAANILIDSLGARRINRTIAELGATETVLGRKMLDFEAKKLGKENYTSARDVGRLLEKISARGGRMLDILSIQKNIAKLPALVPFEDADDLEGVIAHKTGELPGHEHDGGIFFHRSDRPVVVSVMTSGIPGRREGVAFCSNVGKIIYDAFA